MAARPTLVFPLAAWTGPSGVTLIQGVNRDPVTGDYIIAQADDVPGQAEQNVVLRRHRPDLSFADTCTIAKAGHGSSVGIEHDGESMIWVGHGARGVGRFSYINGTKTFTTFSALPNGDVDVFGDVVCIRNKNRYRGYKLRDAKAGKATRIFDFTIPAWGERFQGHSVVVTKPGEGRVLVHRDVKTKGASRAMAFDFKGRKVDEIDTTKMGDEAEGFLVEVDAKNKARVWIVKRTGAADKKRIVIATLWFGELGVVDPQTSATTTKLSAVMRTLGRPKVMKVSSLVAARAKGNVSRYTAYCQWWLAVLGYYKGPRDGVWGKQTQAAYDLFRSKIRPAWPASDCVGPPALTSLTLLRNAAVKAVGRNTMPVGP
jgi:hypothetical protein